MTDVINQGRTTYSQLGGSVTGIGLKLASQCSATGNTNDISVDVLLDRLDPWFVVPCWQCIVRKTRYGPHALLFLFDMGKGYSVPFVALALSRHLGVKCRVVVRSRGGAVQPHYELSASYEKRILVTFSPKIL